MKSVTSPRILTASAAALVSALSLGPAAHAAGFYLQEQSVQGIGRAFSGEGADTGPDSLWWNPASIGGSTDYSGYVGVAGILPSGTVSDTGTLIVRPGQAPASVGGSPTAFGPLQSGALPSGAVAIPINNRIALGFAATAPFDFTTQYDSQSWARYSALRTRLRTYDLQPSVAVAATDFLRLGAGLNIEYADATLTNALPNLVAQLPDGTESLKGNGWDLGWSVGAQVHNDVATLGVSYKSSIKHTLDGAVSVAGLLGPLAANNFAASTTASFRTPWQLIIGGRYKIVPSLTLNAQMVRLGWSEFNAISLGAPVNAALPEGYRDTWSFAGGVDYDVNPAWTVRAGVQYDETPTVDGQRDARVPDSNRVNFGVGGSFKANSHVTVDVGASYVLFQSASIDRPTEAYAGTLAATPILTSGELTGAHAVVVAIGARFKF